MASTQSSVTAGDDTTTDSILPLNLFHVLEEEYVALHKPLPNDHPDWSVTASQVINACAIIAALRRAETEPSGSSDPTTAFSQHVLTLIPGRDKTWGSQLTLDTLVAALNDLLAKPTLYNEQAVQAVELRDETREFARVHFDGTQLNLDGDDLRRFNL